MSKLVQIETITLSIFNYLLTRLNTLKLDYDRVWFKEIRDMLNRTDVVFTADNFAFECFF
jgi:hypothetical protein